MSIVLDSKSFDEKINSSDTILVDFYADWCGPCKRISPIIEQISEERTDLSVAKVNVDESPDIAARFHIQSIPTLILFKNGRIHGTQMGLAGKDELLRFIES